MGKISLFALMLLLFASHAFAACPQETREIYVAAVTGENSGGIFQLEVEVKPGDGSIYTSIVPRTGFSTQESEQMAVDYAFGKTSITKQECDVLFRVKGNFGDNVINGPSAGGAMAAATTAALLNKSIRQDVVMTGTVSPEGNVGEVGGVIEKSIAAADAGAKYILVPKLKIYEALLLSSISQDHGFNALEVSSIEEAEKVLFSDYDDEFSTKFSPESGPIPANLEPIAKDSDISRFSLVAQEVVNRLKQKTSEMLSENVSSQSIEGLKHYFEEEISKYDKLIIMGYPFTAANSAFLLSIDAEYVIIGNADVDLDGSIEEVSGCISSLNPSEKTYENFHWAIGSDLRRLWAQEKLQGTVESRPAQGGYTTLRDLLFAYSWCSISDDLAGQAETIGGEKANESLLYSLAQEKLEEAHEAVSTASMLNYDALWHYSNALSANETGLYGAAIYESTYASTMQRISSTSSENLSMAAEKLASGKRKSLWGKIYFGQGKYLYSEDKENAASPTDSYRIFKYSYELDKVAREIDEELLKGKKQTIQPIPAVEEQEAPSEEDILVSAFLAASVAVLGIAIAYRILRRKRSD